MGGDYTRFTFDPAKGFSGVLRQQGRVSLDSAANELEAILDRRDRAEMYDTVGQAVYPLTTPDAFKIAVDAAGKLTIGQGRMYVDGILAECFGDMSNPANTKFDEHMNDLVGKDPVAFDAQPFYYSKPAFPGLLTPAGAINLVYLDVWQREVTVFEDYSLREKALNGPDTDARVQTAWQVKVMQSAATEGSCTAPPAKWTELTAPSTARLTAIATPQAPAPTPCVISAAGGYTGLENRLYRVEIHTAGTVGGGAKFKWSRDNASLAARVLATRMVSPTNWIITVASTGRDSWMRFEVGHHIELLDDDIEFAMRESGTGGILAKVTGVNHATGEIHVDRDLMALAVVEDRHPRIRRWDIATAAEELERATGTGIIQLEYGITIQFGPTATDTLHAGDHWVFAARTADGTIDPLNDAAPRNTLHHFARLALVTSAAPPVVISDCRIPWPPAMTTQEGCCTVVVRPGQNIQAAVDSLPDAGGCVCLKVGDHPIAEPIRITKSKVTFHGESIGARVSSNTSHTLLIIGSRGKEVHHVDVHDIRFETSGGRVEGPESESGAIVEISHSNDIAVHDCSIAAVKLSVVTGITMSDSARIRIERNQIQGVTVGVRTMRDCSRIDVIDNQIQSSRREDRDFALLGASLMEMRGPCYVTGNRFEGFIEGIRLQASGTERDACFLVENRITRVQPLGQHATPLWGIDVDSFGCTIRDNSIDISFVGHGGIQALGARARIDGNDIRSNLKNEHGWPTGILLRDGKGTEDGIIRGNRLVGYMDAIIVKKCSGVEVLDNDIREGVGLVSRGVMLVDSFGTLVASNRIRQAVLGIGTTGGRDERILNNAVEGGGFGIQADVGTALVIADNVVQDTKRFGIGAAKMIGTTTISRCRLMRCVSTESASDASIVVRDALDEVVVEFNDVLDTGVLREGSAIPAVGIRISAARSRIQGNQVTYTKPENLKRTLESRALLLEASGVQSPLGNLSWGLVLDNSFVGVGFTALVEISVKRKLLDRLTFADNYCEHWSHEPDEGRATVILFAQTALVQGNHVKAERKYFSFDFNHSERVVFMGNMCTGGLLQFPAPSPNSAAPGSKPAPSDRFNFF